MGCPGDDPAEAHRTRLLGFEWIGDVVLLELARPPARHVEEAVIKRETNVGYQWRYRLKAFQDGGQLIRVGRLGRDLDNLFRLPVARVAVPEPDGTGEILEGRYDTAKPVGLVGV